MLDVTENVAHSGDNLDTSFTVDNIFEKLDKIEERVLVLEEKNTPYAIDILAKLDHDLHEVLRRLKRGK